MGPVLVRLGAEFRSRWRSWLSMALLLGVVGGAVLAVAAGARRTDTAYPRFLEAVRAYDVGVFQFTSQEGFATIDFAAVARLPQVAESVRINFYGSGEIGLSASTDPRWETTFSRLKILEGRRADPDEPEEVTVSFLSAQDRGRRVGDVIEVNLIDEAGRFEPVPVRLRIVGIHAAAGEFPPLLDETDSLHATRAFAERHASLVTPGGLFIRLKRGEADVPAFSEGLRELSKGEVLLPFRQSDHAENVERSFRLQAIALWLLAGFAALGIVLVLGQALRRQTLLEATEYPTLRSLGMTHVQLTVVGLARAGIIAAIGAAIAFVIALVASPVFPTGIARIAEPEPGFAADMTVLGLGPLLLIILVGVITLPAAVSGARRAGDTHGLAELQEPSSKPSIADGLSRAGLPTTAVAGVRLALEPGRGRGAVPVRTTVASVTLGIATLAAALAFDSSLGHLLDTPEEYGLRWDAIVLVPFGVDARPMIPLVLEDPNVADARPGTYGVPLEVDGVRADGIALQGLGSDLLRVIEGVGPRASDEIVLGSNTLEVVGKNIGDSVAVAISGTETQTFRITGRGITPPIGDQGHFGEGAFLDYSGLLRIFEGGPPPETLFVIFKPGVDHARGISDLRERIGSETEGITVDAPGLPGDLVNSGRVQNLPVDPCRAARVPRFRHASARTHHLDPATAPRSACSRRWDSCAGRSMRPLPGRRRHSRWSPSHSACRSGSSADDLFGRCSPTSSGSSRIPSWVLRGT